MQFKRARFLSSERRMCQGAHLVSVASASVAGANIRPALREAVIGLVSMAQRVVSRLKTAPVPIARFEPDLIAGPTVLRYFPPGQI